jgi:hypothetical protein
MQRNKERSSVSKYASRLYRVLNAGLPSLCDAWLL